MGMWMWSEGLVVVRGIGLKEGKEVHGVA